MGRCVLKRNVAGDGLDELAVLTRRTADHGGLSVQRDAFGVGRTAEVGGEERGGAWGEGWIGAFVVVGVGVLILSSEEMRAG